MRKNHWKAALLTAGMGVFELSAWVNSPCCQQEFNIVTDLQLSAGYRQDNLHWTIADPSGTPNIAAELQWKDVQILQTKAQGRLWLLDVIYVRGTADFGWIYHGQQTDTDYAGNSKTMTIYQSKARSNDGQVFDFSGGAGWVFNFCLCRQEFTVIPLIGYSYSEQHFRDRHGDLLVNSAFDSFGEELPLGGLGPVSGLHSNYRAKWRGAWLGVDTYFDLCECVEFWGTFEYHRQKYHGTGHWNLRTDFLEDFQQKAKHGHGIYASGSLRYKMACSSFVGVTGSYSWMNSRHGIDTEYLATGEETTRFNGATWHSWSVMLDAGFLF